MMFRVLLSMVAAALVVVSFAGCCKDSCKPKSPKAKTEKKGCKSSCKRSPRKYSDK